MTHSEFCNWLQGYFQGGGNDLQAIQAKLKGLMTNAVFIPQFTHYPPQQIPMTTGDPPQGPPWEVTCGDIDTFIAADHFTTATN